MANEGAAKVAVDWRRVSSTHKLEDLVGLTPPARDRAGGFLFLRGSLLVAAGLAFGLGSIYSILSATLALSSGSASGGKSLGPYEYEAAEGGRSAIDARAFYSLLVPLTIPTAIIFIILHWISMKFFKHAYA